MIKNLTCHNSQDGAIIIDNLVVPVLPAVVTIINLSTGDPVLDLPYLTPANATVTPLGDGFQLSHNGKYGWNNLQAGKYSVTIEDSSQPQICNKTVEVEVLAPDSISFEYNIIPDGCEGNKFKLEILAEGGSGKYKYVVENSSLNYGPVEKSTNIFKGLFSSTDDPYTITVTDSNGCFIQQEVILYSTGGLQIEIGKKNVSCYGNCDGEINVVARGGVEPYKFILKSNPSGDFVAASDCISEDDGNGCYTFSNLCAGDYTLSVIDEAGCVVEYSNGSNNIIEIAQPTPIVVSTPSILHVTCNNCCDGSVTIDSITGGVEPYTIEISGGREDAILPATIFTDGSKPVEIKNLMPGNYDMLVIDSTGCTKVVKFGINSPSQINVTI
jgi:hypothetical protein